MKIQCKTKWRFTCLRGLTRCMLIVDLAFLRYLIQFLKAIKLVTTICIACFGIIPTTVCPAFSNLLLCSTLYWSDFILVVLHILLLNKSTFISFLSNSGPFYNHTSITFSFSIALCFYHLIFKLAKRWSKPKW